MINEDLISHSDFNHKKNFGSDGQIKQVSIQSFQLKTDKELKLKRYDYVLYERMEN